MWASFFYHDDDKYKNGVPPARENAGTTGESAGPASETRAPRAVTESVLPKHIPPELSDCRQDEKPAVESQLCIPEVAQAQAEQQQVPESAMGDGEINIDHDKGVQRALSTERQISTGRQYFLSERPLSARRFPAERPFLSERLFASERPVSMPFTSTTTTTTTTTTTRNNNNDNNNTTGDEDTTSTLPVIADKRSSSYFHHVHPPPGIDAPSQAWGASHTAPPSAATGKTAGGSAAGRVPRGVAGGVERNGYVSFSEVQIEDEEQEFEDRIDSGSWGSYGSAAGGTMRNSGQMSREVLQRRLQKRVRAWRRFLAVMQDHGLRVRKHHRRGNGWAHRVIKYDPSLPGLRWKSGKWWGSNGGQLPLRDVLDVERCGKIVWIKCLHLGTVGFEASLEADAVILYLSMDSLLNKRCGIHEGDVCIPGSLVVT